jgi:hypothetical protein
MDAVMILDGCNDAIVATNLDGTLVYDYEMLLDVFIDDHEMSLDEARDWVSFNIIGLLGNEGAPSIRMPECL